VDPGAITASSTEREYQGLTVFLLQVGNSPFETTHVKNNYFILVDQSSSVSM